MTIYRITLLEWTSETNYNDTIYLDNMMNVNCHNFRKLETAIKWFEKNKDIVLKEELTYLDEDTDVISIDCDIEEWEDDFINGIVYTTNLWNKKSIKDYLNQIKEDVIKIADNFGRYHYTQAQFNTIVNCFKELHEKNKTTTIQENVAKFFDAYPFTRVSEQGIGWEINL